MLILEELQHALKRGAKIYSEVAGYGYSGDAYHITAPSSDGRGAQLCMSAALRHASMQPTDIDYINAHATSTPLGDQIEARAIQAVYGQHASQLYVSSTKGAVGHMLGAAGAVEAIFTVLAVHTDTLPPTLNLLDSDVSGLKYVALEAVKKTGNGGVRAAMTNSFGFGGTNASLIFKKYTG